MIKNPKNPHAVALGKLGQQAWIKKTTPEWRHQNAKKAVQAKLKKNEK